MDRDRDGASSQQSHHTATAVHISRPVTANDGARFQDRPLQGGQVISTTEGPALAAARQGADGKWAEVPMKSGKSALYGY